jgi:hypothetical protein
MVPTFQNDKRVEQMVALYAQDAVGIAAGNFNVALDWTDDSVASVEIILAKLHAAIAAQKPSEDAISSFLKAFGSYIGEVFRKNHGGEWGMILHGEGMKYRGIRWKSDTLFWPWGRVHQRIVEGSENNVWYYYRWMLGELTDTTREP